MNKKDFFEIKNTDFDALSISLASPEQIRSWSFGVVKKGETINYRTLKPEKDGLLCGRIFGPVKNYECHCGKYKKMKYRGKICERCGVEITLSKVRRERMGHIELAYPVAHIWFLKCLPSKIGLALDMSLRNIESVLAFEKYVITEPGITDLNYKQLFSYSDLSKMLEQYGPNSFEFSTGAVAIKELLQQIDLLKEKQKLTQELQQASAETKKRKIVKRLLLLEGFIKANVRPEWMILDVLPVMPADLRPLVYLPDGTRFASSDLNDLYRRLIGRNNRLKKLMELKAPQIVIRNEQRILQMSVDALFDNSRRGKPVLGANKRPLKSLSDMLKGKHGRFRENLLGKRVDYSGRSVISVRPKMKLHQCGLPKKIALELFKPYVLACLERHGIASSIKSAKLMMNKEMPEVWDALDMVIKNHTVLLNRAPTLHRLGILAFEPILVEGKAIQLHPLVCRSFNADFDGDQMAAHVPLGIEAQLEAKILMLSSRNILSPANGKCVITPTKDVILGIYYLTYKREESKPAIACISIGEIEKLISHKIINVHSAILYKIKEKIIPTTPGRVFVYDILPKIIEFREINKALTAVEINEIFEKISHSLDNEEVAERANLFMELGFKYATLSGISVGKDDIIVPAKKSSLIKKASVLVDKYRSQSTEGLITKKEEYNKIIDTWTHCTEKVSKEMMKEYSAERDNSIYMMLASKARGSESQMRQLAGMRGLITKPSGEIIEACITSNFKEGLSTSEYYTSTHGTRKGLSDTALKTANAGYMGRRLIDVAHDVIIHVNDCETVHGICLKTIVQGAEIIDLLGNRIWGRYISKDIFNTEGELIIKAGTLIDTEKIQIIQKYNIEEVIVRSPVTCVASKGICAKCYGVDLSTGFEVATGTAVGVIAAQSIGEPGTQLTMKTFHSGGAVQRKAAESFIETFSIGKVFLNNAKLAKIDDEKNIVLSRNLEVIIKDQNKITEKYNVPYGAYLFVKDQETIQGNTIIAEWDPYVLPLISDATGTVTLVDFVEGVSIKQVTDELSGDTTYLVLNWQQNIQKNTLKPMINIYDGEKLIQSYNVNPGGSVLAKDKHKVCVGDVIAKYPKESLKTRDITRGLPRVAELLEAREPKEVAVINEIEGYVKSIRTMKTRKALLVENENGSESKSYVIGKGKTIIVQEGERVHVGMPLTDGDNSLHDILRILGTEAFLHQILFDIQSVYRQHGVGINDKHIEIILRQMLKKCEIINGGDSHYLVGEQVDKKEFYTLVKKMQKQGLKAPVSVQILQGITKAALHTSSFISAASFQETTKVLTEAAIAGAIDTLEGLKENVIVGRHIPAGTGKAYENAKQMAIQEVSDAND